MTIYDRKIFHYALIASVATTILALGMFTSVARAEAEEVTINVMNHICNEDIQSLEDFENVDGPDDNDSTQFHDKVLACPTVVLEDDEYAEGAIHHEDKHEFNFEVEGDDGEEMDIEDAEYVQMKLCESDVDFDVNGDEEISEDVCLGTSLYQYTDVEGGEVSVTEVETPDDTRPGALEFTPDSIAQNDDADTLVEDFGEVFGEGDHTVMLETDEDDADDVITLHIYNFQDEEYENEDEDGEEMEENEDIVRIDEDLFSALIEAINELLMAIDSRFI